LRCRLRSPRLTSGVPTRTCPVTCSTSRPNGTCGRRDARRSAEIGVDDKDFAREALDGFFRRPAEVGKFYCAACLVERLRRRGAGAFPLAAVQAAVADAFEGPGPLRTKPSGPCEACKKPRRCIGIAAS